MALKRTFYFSLALVSAIWFAFTGWAWTYLANIFISFPFGILSFILWRNGKKTEGDSGRYRIIPFLLGIGSLISLIALLFFL